jgi:hypothetical protein
MVNVLGYSTWASIQGWQAGVKKNHGFLVFQKKPKKFKFLVFFGFLIFDFNDPELAVTEQCSLL